MKILPLFMLLFFMAFYSCKKEPAIPAETTPVNDTIRQVVFDVGSWWAYEDVNTGTVDTVFVKSLTHGQAKYTDGDKGYNLDYYKTVYHITRNGAEYSCYYYLDRAKFSCQEPKLVQTGQEFFFTNDLNGQGKEGNAHCCYLTDKLFSIDYNGMHFTTVRQYEILANCQWDTNLFNEGVGYYFNKNVGFLQFYLGGRLGWPEGYYRIKGYHVNHI